MSRSMSCYLTWHNSSNTAVSPSLQHSRLRRLLSLTNIAWFLGSLLVAVAVMSLVGIYLLGLLVLIPLEVWEALVSCRAAATEGAPPFAPCLLPFATSAALRACLDVACREQGP